MGILKIFIKILFTLTIYSVVLSQEETILFDRISIEQGLSQSTVNSILQDSVGYLWLGTQDGLNKYDGYNFTVYRHDVKDSTSISDNWIWCLYEDEKQNLWVGTYSGGLSCFVRNKGEFINYRHNQKDSNNISGNNVTCIAADKRDFMWIGTWGAGLNCFDYRNKKFIHYIYDSTNSKSISSNNVRCILFDRNGTLWIGTWNGLNTLNPDETQFTRYKHSSTNRTSISSDKIVDIYEDSDGNIWISTFDGGLNKYDHLSKGFIRYKHNPTDKNSLSNDAVGEIVEDRKGNLWIATRGDGINILDRFRVQFISLKKTDKEIYSLSDDVIFSIFKDRTERIWVGTEAAGINIYDPFKRKFDCWRYHKESREGLNNPTVRALWADRDSNLWIGTKGGGVNYYDRKTNKFFYYVRNPNNGNSISHNTVMAVCEDKNNRIWIGTDGGGLDVYDCKRKIFKHYSFNLQDENSISNNYVMNILEDSKGRLWFGTGGGGLNMFVEKDNRFIRYMRTGSSKNEISGNYIRTVYEDSKNNLWIGTWGAGLNKFNLQTKTFIVYKSDPNNSNSLSHNTVMSIYEDSEGILWIATSGGGLNRFNPLTETFKHITVSDGLPNNVVYGILPDKSGNLWLSTNYGLSCYNPASGTIKNYDERDGLQSNEFNQGAYCKGIDGRLYFGGVSGFNSFDPEKIVQNKNIPPIVITKFKILDKPVNLNMLLSSTGYINLTRDDNFFSFEFAALDYTIPEKNKYMYMLEGFDVGWKLAGTRRYAAYTNLDAGEYIFKVKGSNNDDVWNDKGVAIRVVVIPPYWKTNWFRVLVSVCLFSIIIFTYRRRIIGLQKEKRNQQEFSRKLLEFQDGERKRISSELHDSLGQDLLIIKNGLQQCEAMISSKEDIGEELRQLSEVASQAIDEVREVSFDLHPHTLDRLGLKKGIESIINKFSQTSPVRFSSVLDEIDKCFTTKEEINIFRIIQECLNNVIKHSEATECFVQIQCIDKICQIIVKDNGKGFDMQKYLLNPTEYRGMGLTGIQERVKLLNGKLAIKSEKGTVVNISISLSGEKK